MTDGGDSSARFAFTHTPAAQMSASSQVEELQISARGRTPRAT
jgi:hypothetical protein